MLHNLYPVKYTLSTACNFCGCGRVEVFPAFQVSEYIIEFTRASFMIMTVAIRIGNGAKAHFAVDKVEHFGTNIRVNI